jgi:hypothetical protein
MIVHRSVAKEGYMDVDDDDHEDKPFCKRPHLAKTQAIQLNIIKDEWMDGVPNHIDER